MAYGCEKTRRAARTVRYAGVGVAARVTTRARISAGAAGSSDGAIMQHVPRHVQEAWCWSGVEERSAAGAAPWDMAPWDVAPWDMAP